MSKKPFLVLIGGPSGTSKSSLSRKLEEHYGKDKVTILLRRDYYYDNSQNPGFVDFNDPKSQDIDRLLVDLNKLLSGQDTYGPRIKREKWNDGVKLTRTENSQFKKSNPLIIYDGVTALQDEKIRKIANLKVYLHTDDDIRFIKKIQRSRYYKKMIGQRDERTEEELERGSSLMESLPEQIEGWIKDARRVHKKFTEPTKIFADYVFINNERNDLEKIARDVINLIKGNKNHKLESHIVKTERERERERRNSWIWGGAVALGFFVLGIIVASLWYKRKLRIKKRRVRKY